MQTKRTTAIDIIKVLSMVLIIVHHSSSFLNHSFGFFYPYLGRVGLALFTFISGYALYKNNAEISSIKAFYKKRLLRIYLLYNSSFFICCYFQLSIMEQIQLCFINGSYLGIADASLSIYPTRWLTLVYRDDFHFLRNVPIPD
jgi:peptidoglycan/LPS O-acetylase OafA/YrhL